MHPLSPAPDTPIAAMQAPATPRVRPPLRGKRPTRRIALLLLLASALLHAALVLLLLLSVHRPPEPAAISPPSFDMVMEPGAPEGKAGETRPTELPGLAGAPPPPMPAPSPPAPPVPAPPVSTPPSPTPRPPPVPQADASVRLLFNEPPPVAAAPSFVMPQPPPPLPAAVARRAEPAFPAPMDISLGQPSPDTRMPRAMRGTGAVDLVIGRAARDSNGAPPRDAGAAEGTIRVRGANVGKDWLEQLHEWWERHSYYPSEAARRGDDGTVQIHVRVDRYGRVLQVELESSSGSLWLDAGSQAVFRGAALPPFPQSTPEPVADLDITIDYVMVGKGLR